MTDQIHNSRWLQRISKQSETESRSRYNMATAFFPLYTPSIVEGFSERICISK